MEEKSTEATPRRKRSTWTKKEDKKLKHLVEEVHETSWVAISKYFKNRTNKDCRDRYMLHLSPNVVKRKWTAEEESHLLLRYSEFGPKWVKISRFFDKRSPSDLKNRFNLLSKRTKLQPEPFPSLLIFDDLEKPLATPEIPDLWQFSIDPF